MDSRLIISKHEELLVTTLSPSSEEFVYHLLAKKLVSPSDLIRHRELGSTLKKVADLIG